MSIKGNLNISTGNFDLYTAYEIITDTAILITETGQLTITGNIESSGVCPLLVEAGGKLIIDGGKLSNVNLELKPGATLRILNGGIIETQNGFTAPVGVVVDISHGKIL